jgi:CRISPR-associated protein Csx3
MATFNINLDGDLMQVGFGDPATNDVIVRDVAAMLPDILLHNPHPGGPLLKINGPASLPVAVVIAHAVTHLYGAVAVYDPKLGKYVVSVSHNPDFKIGDLID